MLTTELRRFFLALGFFTRLPLPSWVGWQPDELNRAARYFPLVGLIVGLCAALALLVLAQFLPVSIAVFASMALTLRLTGAFHEDGLADSADGLGGGWEKADVLRIMKDSCIGSYGTIVLIMALLGKFLLLHELAQNGIALAAAATLAGHTLSRAVALGIMVNMDYIRDDDSSKSRPVAQGVRRREWLIGCIFVLPTLALLAAFGSAIDALLPLACAALSGLYWARLLKRRLGGYTGDTLGAAQQLSEIAVYVALLVYLP